VDQLAQPIMMKRSEHSRWPTAVIALAFGLLATVLGASPTAAVPIAAATTGYTGAAYVYDAPALLSSPDTAGAGERLPAIEVERMADGTQVILDGHHRHVASQITGIPVDRTCVKYGFNVGEPNWLGVSYGN
jgi:hypothetical protein